MFKDCKSGGYNLEGSKATIERLTSLVLIIALAYTCASLSGRKIKQLGQQKYVSRLTELGRTVRRHSSFWVGLYGQVWMAGMVIRVQHQLQLTHQLLHRLHRTPQLPPRPCQNHPIIHIPDIKKPHPPTPPTRRGAPTCALLPPTCALLPPMCALIPAPSSHKAS